MRLTRRQLLSRLAIGLSTFGLPSCCWRQRVHARCPDWALEPDGMLAIDAHAHFFNASDLPVGEWVERVALRSSSPAIHSIAEILENLTWGAAPDGEEERALLERLSGELASCPEREVPPSVAAARQRRYELAADAIRGAALRGGGRSEPAEFARREVVALPPTYEEFIAALEGPAAGDDVRKKTVLSALHFVVEMLSFRTTSCFDYLDELREGGGPRVDLTLPAIVDYDWLLGTGPSPCPTSLAQQVELARDLAVLTGGRVHAWAPFCPFRELMHRKDPTSTFSSLQLAQRAVSEQGAIGVKLYPALGFAAMGNAGLSVWRDAKRGKLKWLPDEVLKEDFGTRLDGALTDLYRWCVDKDVPVLAHTNASNGPCDEFEELALGPGWAAALDAHPRLRVLFGHLGGAGSDGGFDRAKAFRDLMRPSGAGGAAFADVSYFEEALEDPAALERKLLPLFRVPPAAQTLLLDRLCFGTDWKMLAMERRAGRYARQMAIVIRDVAREVRADPEARMRAFFGTNAAVLLGLRRGEQGRKRLDAFYLKHRVPGPVWAGKLDGKAG